MNIFVVKIMNFFSSLGTDQAKLWGRHRRGGEGWGGRGGGSGAPPSVGTPVNKKCKHIKCSARIFFI